MNSQVTNWLLGGPAWIKYRTQLDLLGLNSNDENVKVARVAMLADPKIQDLISDCTEWDLTVLKRHNDAVHPLHKLAFLADIGLNQQDPGMDKLINSITAHQSPEGPVQVLTNIPAHFGGSGKDEWSWQLCDAPLLLYFLIKLGLKDDPRVQKGINHLVNLARENGWPCAASASLGKFHGPGRRDDPCPYANLLMLKLISQVPELEMKSEMTFGIESALSLWENSQSRSPYLFHMGTDFRKLKVPLIWYDILHLSEVLSNFAKTRQDKCFQEMVNVVFKKANGDGMYTPESIWMKWKDWEFTQKKEPSRWLTFLILRLENRLKSSLD
jgi:hypothetical protein